MFARSVGWLNEPRRRGRRGARVLTRPAVPRSRPRKRNARARNRLERLSGPPPVESTDGCKETARMPVAKASLESRLVAQVRRGERCVDLGRGTAGPRLCAGVAAGAYTLLLGVPQPLHPIQPSSSSRESSLSHAESFPRPWSGLANRTSPRGSRPLYCSPFFLRTSTAGDPPAWAWLGASKVQLSFFG